MTQNDNKKQGYPLPIWTAFSALGYYFMLRPQLLKWGTKLGESQRRLPGDEIIPHPNFQATHAINIDAPPTAVWPWIAQMGRERTGYYGMDLLNNQGVPSVTFVRKDIADPAVGMEMDGGYHIMEVEPQRLLLFGGFNLKKPPITTVDTTSLYLLETRRDGSTRLIARRRAFSYGTLAVVYNLVYEALYFLMIQQQFARLKEYAESMQHLR